MGYSKSNAIRYFSNVRQSVLNKILAPDVFNYLDSKSESWHRAKKIREAFMDNKSSPSHFSRNRISWFYQSALLFN